EAAQVSIKEVKTVEGASYLELKLPSRSQREGFWNFLERYGYRYGDTSRRPLLPSEVLVMLKKLPEATKKKLSAKGFFPQDGYILQCIPVPPNCLSVPDVSDGITVMSSDHSITILRKVLKQVEIIKSSRSGTPNFESHEVEANDLQAAVAQYLEVRGTAKASRDVDTRFGISKEPNNSATKAWLEKMKTLFIRKGCGFSSRSVITGDAYKGVHEIGLPFEVAQRITFEERVTQHNMLYLQKLVDEKLCLTYRDGSSTYSLREGSKGHIFLRPGQVVHRRIMDGDIVFINRPPTTHKHSLQALSVNVCSNSIIQFEYGVKPETKSFFAAGEPVGVLAATAMSNPAYKAVLDSSSSSNSSWEMMKEILLCTVNFKNDLSDRRVILYLNDCDCGRKYCRENAAFLVKNQLKKVSLKDIAVEFLHSKPPKPAMQEGRALFLDLNISMQEICDKCQGTIDSIRKKKKAGHLFKRIKLSVRVGLSVSNNLVWELLTRVQCDSEMCKGVPKEAKELGEDARKS
ncbi:DNA-directed RNA polymerase, partial [Sarracenia purpurea var. burkii]